MLRASVFATVLVSAATTAALAQPQNRPQGYNLYSTNILSEAGMKPSTHSLHNVLKLAQVQNDLKLNAAQKARLKEVEEKYERARGQTRERYDEKRKSAMTNRDVQGLVAVNEDMKKKLTDHAQELDATLLKILDRDQGVRLNQIRYQAEGPEAFMRPEVQERLNLAPEQVEEIRAVVSEGKKGLRTAATLPPEVLDQNQGPEERLKSMKSKGFKKAVDDAQSSILKVRSSTMKAVAEVMTKGQRDRYRKMIGEPFDFKNAWQAGRVENRALEHSP
jgi:hypothetical protein